MYEEKKKKKKKKYPLKIVKLSSIFDKNNCTTGL